MFRLRRKLQNTGMQSEEIQKVAATSPLLLLTANVIISGSSGVWKTKQHVPVLVRCLRRPVFWLS